MLCRTVMPALHRSIPARRGRALPGRPVLSVALLLCAVASSASAQVLTLNGSAAFVGNRLRLTPAVEAQAGSAWQTTKRSVQRGFSTSFQFQITNLGPEGNVDNFGNPGADGFAFVIQNSSVNALGGDGGGLGYDGIPNSLAVEFDTWGGGSDPNGNHVSVHTRGTAPNSQDESASLGIATNIPNLSNGSIHTGSVSYSAPTGGQGVLQVFVDGQRFLAIRVNLGTLLSLDNGRAWVGFTAATGGSYENHDILSWSFQ